MPELAPGQMLDQYELLDTIACSGMATVFRARDIENDRTVALKVPYLQYSSDIVFHQHIAAVGREHRVFHLHSLDLIFAPYPIERPLHRG